MRFQAQRVIVTGAAGSIGSGIVAAFAREGARICLSDLRTDKAEAVAKSLGLAPDRYLVHQTDIRVQASIQDLVESVVTAWGGVDILVNNAGLYPDNLLLEMAADEWDRVLDTNLRGPFLLSQAVGRRFITQGGGGKIVNITSQAAVSTRPGATHYSASKAGLNQLTMGLALELAQYGVRCNAVAAGLTRTDNEVNPIDSKYLDALGGTIPLGRLALPKDTANAVVFLCSDEAEFITGEIIKVDGGVSAGRSSLPRATGEKL